LGAGGGEGYGFAGMKACWEVGKARNWDEVSVEGLTWLENLKAFPRVVVFMARTFMFERSMSNLNFFVHVTEGEANHPHQDTTRILMFLEENQIRLNGRLIQILMPFKSLWRCGV
jgi:hypothetical protein